MRNSHALRVGRKPPRRRAVSHHSREVPITERSGTASRKRTRIGAAHKSRFIFASRISRVQVSGLVLWQPGATPRAPSGLLAPGAGASQHTGASAATPATGLRRLFLCFVFLGGLRRPVAGVAGAALPSCCVCWWAVSLLWRSRKPRRRVAPRQHSVAALALAGGRPAQLRFWTPAEEAPKRSGAASRPGNEVFALLGGTGTGQCPVVGHRHHALI